MVRRLGPSIGQLTRREGAPAVMTQRTARATTNERLIEIVDQCTAAKAAADELGNHFLSYLLAMTIQEARSAMRPTLPNALDNGR